MKQAKRNVQSMLKTLKVLTEKAERVSKELDKLEKAQVAKKSAPKAKAKAKARPKTKTKAKARPKAKTKARRKAPAKKAKKMTAGETVYAIISRSRKGVDTPTLKKKTGFKDQKVRDAVYKLKKQGKIKSEKKGIYQKA